MRVKNHLSIILFFLVIFLFVSSSPARTSPVYAVVNCKIIPVSSSPIEKGIIIIRDGLIESLGSSEEIAIPEDAEIVEAEGLIAYPGLIDAHTNLFIELPKEEPPQRGRDMRSREKESGRYPDVLAFKLLKPKKSSIESFRKIGVTTVLVAPKKGIYAGQSVLLNLNGEKPETMVVKNPVALHVDFSTARGLYPATVMGTMAFLRQSFLDAEYYRAYKFLYAKSAKGMKRPEYNPFLEEIMLFVLEKKQIIFTCDNQEDIKRALGLIEEFKLNGLLSGANEAWRVAGKLKQRKLPLLISLNFKPPTTSLYVNQGEEMKEKAEKEIYPGNAANLHKSGVKFALTSYGLSKADRFLENIRKAITAGLPKEEALKALSLYPASFLGVSSQMGSLSPGKMANVILTSGEIFEKETRVKKVFVDGVLFKVKKPPEKGKAPALDITGKWQGTVSGQMGELETTVEFEQEGNDITGKVSSSYGQWEISEGYLSGNELTFTYTATIMGETMELAFSGKVEEDSIDGTITSPIGSLELRLTRIPEAS